MLDSAVTNKLLRELIEQTNQTNELLAIIAARLGSDDLEDEDAFLEVTTLDDEEPVYIRKPDNETL